MKDAGYEHAHSSPIKTPQQLAVVLVLAFAIPVIGIILLTQFIVTDRRTDPATLAPEAVAARIQPVARVELADAAGPRALRSGEEVYKQVCSACHAQGVAGAAKTGDQAAWAPHIKEGLAALVKNAINGVQTAKGVMPPRGGDATLTDWEVAAAVVYLTNQAGANFKEPPRPAAPSAPAAAAAPAVSAPVQVAAAPSTAPAAAAPAAAAGASPEKLLQNYGCLACHTVDKKVIGPSYKEVAAKYAGDKNAVAELAKKVKAGGQGVWGQIPMPPHPQVSDADLQTMVKYILAQK
jgi:cytochrome c551/c552